MADKPFHFAAVVRRTVMDNITLTVRALNPSEAHDKAKEFLREFPSPASVDGVIYGYIDNRENLDSDVLDLKEIK